MLTWFPLYFLRRVPARSINASNCSSGVFKMAMASSRERIGSEIIIYLPSFFQIQNNLFALNCIMNMNNCQQYTKMS